MKKRWLIGCVLAVLCVVVVRAVWTHAMPEAEFTPRGSWWGPRTASMMSMQDSIYVLVGATLYKVDPGTLKIKERTTFPVPKFRKGEH